MAKLIPMGDFCIPRVLIQGLGQQRECSHRCESNWYAYLYVKVLVASHSGERLMEEIMPNTKQKAETHARIKWAKA